MSQINEINQKSRSVLLYSVATGKFCYEMSLDEITPLVKEPGEGDKDAVKTARLVLQHLITQSFSPINTGRFEIVRNNPVVRNSLVAFRNSVWCLSDLASSEEKHQTLAGMQVGCFLQILIYLTTPHPNEDKELEIEFLIGLAKCLDLPLDIATQYLGTQAHAYGEIEKTKLRTYYDQFDQITKEWQADILEK